MDGCFKIPVLLKKIVLTISLTSSSNPECKVSMGDQLEVIWGWSLLDVIPKLDKQQLMSFATPASFIVVRNLSICISLGDRDTSAELYPWSEIL